VQVDAAMIWYAAKFPTGTDPPWEKACLIVDEFASRRRQIENAKRRSRKKKTNEQASESPRLLSLGDMMDASSATSPASSASTSPSYSSGGVSPASTGGLSHTNAQEAPESSATSPASSASTSPSYFSGGVSPASTGGVSPASSSGESPAADASAGEQALTLWRASGSPAVAPMQELDGAAEDQLHGDESPTSSGGMSPLPFPGDKYVNNFSTWSMKKRRHSGCLVCAAAVPVSGALELVDSVKFRKLRGKYTAVQAERDILARTIVEGHDQGLDYWDFHVAAERETDIARRAAKLAYENNRLLGDWV
jgi:hypothetical protein